MSTLHERQGDAFFFEPEEGQRTSSCSNEASPRCPSLGLTYAQYTHDQDEALRCLAKILVEVFLNNYVKNKTSSRSE